MFCRARTNPSAKQLHTVLARGTGVDVTGCIILLQVSFGFYHIGRSSNLLAQSFLSYKFLSILQFCPRLTKGGGRLEHEHVGAAIFTLNRKLKVANLVLKG